MTRLVDLESAIAARFGFTLDPRWVTKLERVVHAAADSHRRSVDAHIARAMSDPAVLREIAGALTIGASHFFRHADQYPVLSRIMREQPKGDVQRPFRVWSAGCAAGEEPYSVAILLGEQLTARPRQVEIHATDLDGDALERARVGLYSKWALHATSASRRARYFQQQVDGSFLLAKEVRASVTLTHLSLQEHLLRMPSGFLDCIFFRNVAIYLTKSARDTIYQGFARVLRPGGKLFTSATDPRPSPSLYVSGKSNSTAIYTPFREGGPLTRPQEPQRAARPPRTELRPKVPDGKVEASDPRVWDAVQRLADRGEYVRSLALCSAALRLRPTDPEGFALRGTIALGTGHSEDAAGDFRAALFLDPGNALTRYWYAVSLRDSQRVSEAHRQVRQLLESLQKRTNRDVGEDELLAATQSLREVLG